MPQQKIEAPRRVAAPGEERNASLLAALRAVLATEGVPRVLRPGDLLWSQGERAEALAVVHTGTLREYRISPLGQRAVLSLPRAPEVLGDVAVLDGRPHLSSAEAVTTCEVVLLSREVLVDAILHDAEVCQAMFARLGAQVRQLTEQQTDFVFLDLPGRVAKTLLRLADGTVPPSVRLNQTTLAQIVGGARQSVNEAVVQFVRRGWLHAEPGRFIILDFEALSRRGGLPPAMIPPPASAARTHPARA
ncbi:MAG: Crp/Fnr family transcriptional regulator [Micromonosporaceae bacterium]|nr:Crp/Fnr family transcriptional regulator [Micromonosporaceae bacterium]